MSFSRGLPGLSDPACCDNKRRRIKLMVDEMRDDEKTRGQLLEELVSLRKRVAEAEALESRYKRAEDRLFRLERAVENMQIGLTIRDTAGKNVYSNPAGADMQGNEVGALVGKDEGIFAPRARWK